jgi:hypothetical protein
VECRAAARSSFWADLLLIDRGDLAERPDRAAVSRNGRVSVAHLDMPDDPLQLRDWIVHATNYAPDAVGP